MWQTCYVAHSHIQCTFSIYERELRCVFLAVSLIAACCLCSCRQVFQTSRGLKSNSLKFSANQNIFLPCNGDVVIPNATLCGTPPVQDCIDLPLCQHCRFIIQIRKHRQCVGDDVDSGQPRWPLVSCFLSKSSVSSTAMSSQTVYSKISLIRSSFTQFPISYNHLLGPHPYSYLKRCNHCGQNSPVHTMKSFG